MLIELHKFQERAFTSPKPIVINAAGIQSGKTTTGGIWLTHRATQILPTDNLIIAAPTYKILTQATLPRFLQFAKGMGQYYKGDSIFKFSHGPTVYVRSLSCPHAMEGITDVEGVWLDEGGLISLYAWENIMGRAAFREAKVMVTTTPYSLNWLFQIWKKWKEGKADDVDFISYKSIDNPHFPKSEFIRQKKKLDPIRFAMKFEGVFGAMQGLVYPSVVFIRAIPMPPGTVYYAGVDWGYTTPGAIVIRAITPNGIHYRVNEVYKAGLDIDEWVQIAKSRKQLYNIELFICDPSMPAYISKFNKEGLTAVGANNAIINGITEHRSLIKSNKFYVFEDENPYGKDEYNRYHYPEKTDLQLDDDEKEQLPVATDDHSLDADRYVTVFINSTRILTRNSASHSHSDEIPKDALKRLNWLKKGGSSRIAG